MDQKHSYIGGRIRSVLYAVQGVRFLVASQANARIHLAATLVVVLFGSYLSIGAEDWKLIILCIALVWAAEAFNTSVEMLADIIVPFEDIRVKRVKDVAAAAVLIAVVGAILVGLLVFGPYVETII